MTDFDKTDQTDFHEHAPHLSETSARQGRWGRPVFWVLTISTCLAVVAVFGAWTWRAASPVHRPDQVSQADATGWSHPAYAPKQTPTTPRPPQTGG